jgi:hypothetical protein
MTDYGRRKLPAGAGPVETFHLGPGRATVMSELWTPTLARETKPARETGDL